MAWRFLAAGAMALALPCTLGAQGLSVAPVYLDIGAGERATSFTLSNGQASAMDVQVRALRWTQSDNEDVYAEDAQPVIVSPPRATLAPGAQQVVRVYLRDGAGRGAERAYRVVIDQLPDADTLAQGSGVRFPLRILLPLFASGAADGSAQLQWRAHLGDDRLDVSVRDEGPRHVRISGLRVASSNEPDAPAIAAGSPLLYVLAGSERTLRLPRPAWLHAGLGSIVVLADSDAGPLQASVVLSRGD